MPVANMGFPLPSPHQSCSPEQAVLKPTINKSELYLLCLVPSLFSSLFDLTSAADRGSTIPSRWAQGPVATSATRNTLSPKIGTAILTDTLTCRLSSRHPQLPCTQGSIRPLWPAAHIREISVSLPFGPIRSVSWEKNVLAADTARSPAIFVYFGPWEETYEPFQDPSLQCL